MRHVDPADTVRRCDRLLSRSALLDTHGVRWGAVGDVELDPAVLDCLVYMRDVEGFTNRYLTGLVAHPCTLADDQIARFLPIWQREEGEHARALDRYLRAYARRRAVRVPGVQPAPPVDDKADRRAVRLTRPVGHVVAAAHMTWGAANELLTMTGYRLLAGRCGDPVLSELLARIAAQEARHYGFYRLKAEARLSRSPIAQHVLRLIMKNAWTPVGIGEGYKSPSEFDRLLSYLASEDRGQRAISSMDGAFTRLPGFRGVRIYERAVAESRARTASATASAAPVGRAP